MALDPACWFWYRPDSSDSETSLHTAAGNQPLGGHIPVSSRTSGPMPWRTHNTGPLRRHPSAHVALVPHLSRNWRRLLLQLWDQALIAGKGQRFATSRN